MSSRIPAVYVSSTITDLLDYREAIRHQIASMNMHAVAMETAPADERPPLGSCISAVRSCDVYVGIFAHRYGFIPAGETQSITELEYRAAGDAGIPRLIFLVDDNQPWRPSDCDAHDREGDGGTRIQRFRDELRLLKTVQFFTTPENLARKVAAALHDWNRTTAVPTSAGDVVDSNLRHYLEDCVHKEQELDTKYVSLTGTAERPVPLPTAFPPQLVPRSFRVIQTLRRHEKEQELVSSITEVLERYPQVVVLGDPGSGKSTTLHYLQLIKAQQALRGVGPVPLYINLAEWPESIPDLKSLIVHERDAKGCPRVPASHLLLLLDGLNEVRERDYVTCVDNIQDWLDGNPAAQVVIATRQQQYLQNRQLRTSTVTLHPLTGSQVELFVEKYLGPDDARGLLSSIDWEARHDANARHFARLAENPFQLALLCYVYAETGKTLPSTRGELLRILVQTVYQREVDLGTHGKLTYDEMQAGLGELALSAVQTRSSTAIGETWAVKRIPPGIDYAALRTLGVNAGLLRLGKNDRFIQFAHQLIMEYFAAERLSNHIERLPHVVRKPRFHHGDRGNQATDEVCFTLAEVHPDAGTALAALASVDPFLAADALVESRREVNAEIKATIARKLVETQKSGGDQSRSALIRRLPFFGDVGVEALQHSLLHGSKPERRLAVTALAAFQSVGAIDQLVKSLEDRDRWVRREARGALRSIADRDPEIAAAYLQKWPSTRLDLAVIDLLSPLDERQAKPVAKERHLEPDVTLSAAVIGEIDAWLDWAEKYVAARRAAVTGAHRALVKDEGGETSESNELQEVSGKESSQLVSVPELLILLAAAPTGQSNHLIAAIARHGTTAVPELLEALKSSNPRLRRRVPRALARIGDRRAVEPLTVLVNDWDNAVSMHAARALARFADDSMIPLFESLAWSRDPWIRVFGLKGLLKAGGVNGYEYLLPHLEDEHPTVQIEVAQMLAAVNAPIPVGTIERLTSSSQAPIRWAALTWLLKLDLGRGMEALATMLRSGDTRDQEWAATVLARVIEQVDRKPARKQSGKPLIAINQLLEGRRWLDARRGDTDEALRAMLTAAITRNHPQLARQCAIALYLLEEPSRALPPQLPVEVETAPGLDGVDGGYLRAPLVDRTTQS